MAIRIDPLPSAQRTTESGATAEADVPLVYLGKSPKEELYYFLSVKDGVGRFLRFGFAPFYPFWVGGVNTGATHTVPDRLLLTDCPEGALEEVRLFVQGKVKYEFEPSRKGKKASVKKVYLTAMGNTEDAPGGERTISPGRPESVDGSSKAGKKVLPRGGPKTDRLHDVPLGAGSRSRNSSGRRTTGSDGTPAGLPRSGKSVVPKSSTNSQPPNGRVPKSSVLEAKEVKKENEVRVPKQKEPEIELAQNVEAPNRRRGRPPGSLNKVKSQNPNSGGNSTGTRPKSVVKK